MTLPGQCNPEALFVLWTTIAISAAVFGLMVRAIVRGCKSPQVDSPGFVRHTVVEVVWAIIPVLIFVVSAAPAVKALVAADSCPVTATHR